MQEPLPQGVMKFTILEDPSLVIIYYYILSLSDLCLGVKKILKGIMHFHYIGGHEIKHFGKSFLGHHNYTLSLSQPCPWVENEIFKEPCPWVEKEIFKEIHQFYTFSPKLPPPGGGGHEIYNFLSPCPTNATYQIWLRLASSSWEEDVNAQRMPTHSNRSSELLRWP